MYSSRLPVPAIGDKAHQSSLFEATTTFLPIFTNSEARPSDRLAATWPQLTELEIGSNSLKATLPSGQSTKVPREPTLIAENEGEKLRAE